MRPHPFGAPIDQALEIIEIFGRFPHL